jgi:multisubunit Na+/H+ antiporter MnhG subunit
MHRHHLIPCGVMLVAVALIAMVWGFQPGTLAAFGVMLLCPLVMVAMMRAMHGSTEATDHDHEHHRITR